MMLVVVHPVESFVPHVVPVKPLMQTQVVDLSAFWMATPPFWQIDEPLPEPDVGAGAAGLLLLLLLLLPPP